MNNRFVVILLVLIVGFVGIFWFSKDKNSSSGSGSGAQPTNHIKGEGKKGVTVTEYGDYQCSACFRYEPLIAQVYDKYKADIFLQFRNFPITSSHPNAMAAARAAEAAAKQNKFWEMHDILFSTAYQPSGEDLTPIQWAASNNPQPFFESYAQQLKLNMEQFKRDMASAEVNGLITADMEAGRNGGVTGTPSFFIDGKKIDTPTSIEEFSKVIDEAIKNKQ